MNEQKANFTQGFALNPTQSAFPYLWRGLVGAWCPSFGKQGDRLYDFSGRKHTATLTNFAFSGATSNYVPGIHGWALDYDGTNDLGDAGNIPEIDTGTQTMTVAFWMRSSTAQTNHAIITYDNNSSLSPGTDWYLMLKTNFTIGGFGDNSEYNSGYASSNLTDGKWHFVVVVSRQTSIDLWVDGEQKYTTGITKSNKNFNSTFSLQFAPAENVSRYTGSLGDIYVWNRDITVKEILDLSVGNTPFILAPQPAATPRVTILDVFEVFATAENNISKIISYNPLIYVTNTNPAKIVVVDISDPQNPSYDDYTLTSGTFAQDVVVNTVNEKIYVACSNGTVISLDLNNLNTQTTINLSDTDEVITLEKYTNYGLVYASTDSSTGELYLIDDREMTTVEADLRVIHPTQVIMNGNFNAIQAMLLNADARVLGIKSKIMNGDFKCLSDIFDDITPLKQTDFTVFVDNVELEDFDVDLSSIQITHNIDEKSRATLTLTRNHDNFDYDKANNYRQISNQNNLKIYLRDILEFDGSISELNCEYGSTDRISLSALGEKPLYNYNTQRLSLPSLTERLGLYDVLIQNPQILNPVIGAEETNPSKYKGIFAPLGKKVVQSVARFLEFDSFGTIADKIQDPDTNGDFIFQQNWTYFWSPTVTNVNPEFTLGQTRSISFLYIGTSLSPVSSDLWLLDNAKHRKQRIYEDIVTRLGDGKITKTQIYELNIGDEDDLFNSLESAGYIDTNGNVLSAFKDFVFDSTELNIPYSNKIKLALYNLIDESFGIYLGNAPYKTISVRNGILVSKERWEDRPNGLYSVQDESYDFTNYVQQVAELEFEKIKNINDSILPDTSASFSLTLDAYQYYNLKVLNRINVENTLQANIFNNNNGFPVSIKSITLDASTMQASLSTDNIKSVIELEEIDGRYPSEDDFINEGKELLIAPKVDMQTRLEVD